jgi:Ca-activated chloride channel homolog
MMRLFFLISLWALSLPLHAGDFWSSLWRNADQRGEALMQQGDPAGAANEYRDPRRKAYAKLQAGDYAGAAEELNPLHESEDDYNRGNALAHLGELQAALDAYDAALKSKPQHQDARHNRELVANALKNQPPQDKKNGDSKDKNDSGQKNQEQKDPNQKDQKSDQGPDSTDDKNKSQQDKDGQGKEGQSKDGKQQDENKPAEPSKKDQSKAESKDAKGKEGQDKSAEKNSNQSAQKDAQERAKDDAEQARRELAASQEKPASEGKKGEPGLAETPPPAKPKSEQQIAKEQWLRSIPDDPSGLLRRKFLIEHSIRHPKAQP